VGSRLRSVKERGEGVEERKNENEGAYGGFYRDVGDSKLEEIFQARINDTTELKNSATVSPSRSAKPDSVIHRCSFYKVKLHDDNNAKNRCLQTVANL
jgi:hypothetical protein